MSKNLMSMPVGGQIQDSPSAFTIPWMKYLKALGDDLLTANKVVDASNKNFKYVINANICFFTYYTDRPDTSDMTVALPYTALLAFDVGGVIYAPGTKSIVIPSNTAYVHGWYVCNFNNLARV